jgi:hypothetical protein
MSRTSSPSACTPRRLARAPRRRTRPGVRLIDTIANKTCTVRDTRRSTRGWALARSPLSSLYSSPLFHHLHSLLSLVLPPSPSRFTPQRQARPLHHSFAHHAPYPPRAFTSLSHNPLLSLPCSLSSPTAPLSLSLPPRAGGRLQRTPPPTPLPTCAPLAAIS